MDDLFDLALWLHLTKCWRCHQHEHHLCRWKTGCRCCHPDCLERLRKD